MHPHSAPNYLSELTPGECFTKYREMADVADQLAAMRQDEMRQVYLNLAKRWRDLAREMEPEILAPGPDTGSLPQPEGS
jgi:hypothetical protein